MLLIRKLSFYFARTGELGTVRSREFNILVTNRSQLFVEIETVSIASCLLHYNIAKVLADSGEVLGRVLDVRVWMENGKDLGFEFVIEYQIGKHNRCSIYCEENTKEQQ